MKKFVSLLCCLVLSVMTIFAATGCGGKNGKKTVIQVQLKSGGTGTQWLVDAGNRFSALHEHTSFEEGKEGVVIEPVPVETPSLKTAETDGYAIYDIMGTVNIENDARGGKVLCIDDVLTNKSDLRDGKEISPSDKIPTEQRSRYMYNGSYYAAPSCEFYPVITYDRNLFDRYHLYLVKPDVSADLSYDGIIVAHDSEILGERYYFLPDNNDDNEEMKSCGPDGVYETDDDGLPSSLYELIALCEYMKGKGIIPFNFTGNYSYYSNFLLSAIYTALQGYEDAKNAYEFKGEIEIVTGLDDDYLFAGVDESGSPACEIRKPITKKVTLTEENGYYSTWKIEKYYAEAFMDLCIKKGWFDSSAMSGDQKAAMNKFVFSDHNGSFKIAMHIDGSYWYNEATEVDDMFAEWEEENSLVAGLVPDRDVRIMPLPVNITESVVEGEGKAQAIIDMNYGIFVLNKNLEENPGLMKASKEFLSFLLTDAELSKYTASTSILRSMNYSLLSEDEDEISSYGKRLVDAISSGRTKRVYFAGNNKTFNANTASFVQSWDNAIFGVNSVSPVFYDAIVVEKKDGFTTVEEIFSHQALTKARWQNMYKGSLSVSDIDGLVELKLGN